MSTSKVTAPAVIGALGVVYGDIGTSPLYAFRAALSASAGVAPREDTVFGVLSLIFWALLLVVSIKYLTIVVRADNDGQGGILALLARLEQHFYRWGTVSRYVLGAGMLGAALFFCDAIITPAISVLSAVEGLAVADPGLERWVLPAATGILVGLVLVQRIGTASVSRWFGPVMVLWFVTLGVLGLLSIMETPRVLGALNPAWGLWYLQAYPGISSLIIGAVFLCITGAEALYADVGHFGKWTVRVAWFGLVWPGLLLNYFGQGALALRETGALDSPFYRLAPEPLLPFLIGLATAATVIASQAVITGAFSLTRQAVQLDFMPRVNIVQTSARERGQVYVPFTNWTLLALVLLMIALFRSSEALAAAYGAAVAGTEWITTLLACLVARQEWRWPLVAIVAAFAGFFMLDTVFVVANLSKFAAGAWVPLLLAAGLFLVFEAWREGRERLRRRLDTAAVSFRELPRLMEGAARVPGTAVFLASRADVIPSAFLRNLEHNRVLHENVVFLNVEFQRVPQVDSLARLAIEELSPSIYTVKAAYGFMETPNMRDIIQQCDRRGLRLFGRDYTFFLGQHVVVPLEQRKVHRWQRAVFAWLQRRSAGAAEFFGMPLRRVVILSTVVEI
jgi:KUP system potassium uptake protein